MDTAGRFSLDDLRRFGVAVLTTHGWTAIQAGLIAGYHLWLDVAGARDSGIGALPGLLESVAAGTVKPGAGGRLSSERSAAVVLHAESSAPVLALGRAGEIAAEKAREAGVGFVRVVGLTKGAIPTAPIVAEIAVGPYVGMALGPGSPWSVAIPSLGGLPAVLDTALGGAKGIKRAKGASPLGDLLPAAGWLAGGDGVLVGAVHVGLFGDVAPFQPLLDSWQDQPGLWLPGPLAEMRNAAARDGITLDRDVFDRLTSLAETCGVVPLSPQDES